MRNAAIEATITASYIRREKETKGMVEAKRRLAAVLAADVAGYSRLMGDDERATIAMLDQHRAVFKARIEANQGRVVDMAGDSVLAVFETAIGAVEAAVATQGELAARNEALPEARRMRFRVGVNLGDIYEKDDGTAYGDGVNVAARLESLAEPGGVIISGTTFDQVDDKLACGFAYLGEKQVKNITKPVRAYRADLGGGETRIRQSSSTPEAERPSIAVLPFENLSRDPDQEYFADGIAEDLITELSRLRWLLVTARNSTFSYKGQSPDVRDVGRDLGVRYVVEGSVRRAGARVRITAQLVDAVTGNHIWAERYDRDLSDIFALQDEITETLVAALQGEVGEVERDRAHRKPPDSLDAWSAYQRGLWHMWRLNAADMAEARRLFEAAANLDANFAQPVAALAYTLFGQVVYAYADSPIENLEQALQFAHQAIDLDDKEAMAYFAQGRVQTMRGEYDAAIAELRTAIDLNPSMGLAHYGLAFALVLTGQSEQAISECDTAIRLSPRDPFVWAFYGVRALARFFSGDYEAAVEDARHAIRQPAAQFWAHALLASALALLDRREAAKSALDTLLEVKPDFSPDAALTVYSPLKPEALRPQFRTWIDGLHKAGLAISDEPAAAD